MNPYLAKIVSGFLIGLGFVGAIALTLFAMDRWSDFRRGVVTYKPFGPEASLTLAEHHLLENTYGMSVVGTLKNSGHSSWNNIELTVELFDSQGTFLDKCSGYEDATLEPGSAMHFKVTCNEPGASYDHYSIAVDGASYVQMQNN